MLGFRVLSAIDVEVIFFPFSYLHPWPLRSFLEKSSERESPCSTSQLC